MKNNISLVVSLYEEEGISSFWLNLSNELKKIKNIDFEIIWVNDGSFDKTQILIEEIIKENNKNIIHRSIEFSKNFGHEAAMIAGIDNAKGNAIICLDSDEQHPPAKIKKMIESFNKGNDIVLMERLRREDNSFLKKSLSSFFYKIINFMSSIKFQNNSTDFFLISEQVASILKTNYREQTRFIRGFIQSIGFKSEVLPFEAPSRMHGESNYSYFSLLKLAFNAIFSFSNKPLRISMFFSIIFIIGTIFFSLYTLYMFIYGDTPPSGYTTIVLFMAFSFSLLFLTITVLSLYFEKTIQETRKRPIYIIKKNI